MEINKLHQLDKPQESLDVNVEVKDGAEIESDDNQYEVPVDLNSSSEEQGEEEMDNQTLSSRKVTEGSCPMFETKLDFTMEMQKQVKLVMEECIQVLKKDPREYHPFYLIVDKWINVGLEQGHIAENRVDLVWEKCDGVAASEFEKSTGETSTCKLEYSQPHSEYLDYILNIHEDNSDPTDTLFRHIRKVEVKWKQYISDEPCLFQDMRSNLKARLKLFECSKNLTSLYDCGQMNILWSRLLTSQLFPPQIYKPSSSERRTSETLKGKRQEQQLRGATKPQGEEKTREAETPEKREKRLSRTFEKRASETPEQRERRLKKQCEITRLRKERQIMNETPGEREERIVNLRIKSARCSLKRKMIREGNFNEEEFEKRYDEIVDKYIKLKTLVPPPTKKFKLDKESQLYVEETPEEREERLAYIRIQQGMNRLRRKMVKQGNFNEEEYKKKSEEILAKFKTSVKVTSSQQANHNRDKESQPSVRIETPEEKEERQTKNQISNARRKLKKEMMLEGNFNQEEFQRRLDELVEQVRAKRPRRQEETSWGGDQETIIAIEGLVWEINPDESTVHLQIAPEGILQVF